MVCWGRLRTMPTRFKARLTVSSETRRPVLSGQVVDQALQRPQRERKPYTARPSAHSRSPCRPVRLCNPRRPSGAWRNV
jgi:hypothetical protein